jgi:hypothetical protein
MVGQVTVVSILMMVQAGLTLMMGLLLTVMGPAMFVAARVDKGPRNSGDEAVLSVLAVVYLLLGLGALTSAILTLVGGIRAIKFRNRTFVIVALFSNIIPVFTFYCAPTSLGVMIYGLIVMFNRDVAQAFEMAAERGMSSREIQDEFARRRWETGR